jgi:cell shape-determining protein MreC
MRRTIAYPYFLLGFLLFCWLSLPKNVSDRARSLTVASLSPIWKWENSHVKNGSAELSRLQLENQNLRTQIDAVYEWLVFDGRISEQFEILKALLKEQNQTTETHWRSFFQRRASHLGQRLQSQLSAFPAQVIYRDPSSWSSSLWINVGEENNRALSQPIIAKNSPVVAGAFLVGVVDYVGKKQSRVRLITDSGLSPAVRAVRGGAQNRELAQLVDSMGRRLEGREDLFETEEEKQAFFQRLSQLKSKIGINWEDGYLAKGELHGSSAPFWRSRGQLLKGIGFNFDYGDEEGSARDLRTGRPVGTSGGAVPILKEGDLLVTSGLDQIFPPGLLVGTVSWIGPIKEGGYAYEIEARPSANNLNDLQTLFILPPLANE